MALDIRQFPCLSDNYGFLLHDQETGATAAVDTPDADAIARNCEAAGWRLTHILNTHHHPDHAGGNLALKERFGVTILGPANETIPGRDVALKEGDTVDLGASRARVLDTPGHTSGHIVYIFDEDRAAFVGDTLFALGCGRLFEGTPEQMWASLSKLMALPDDYAVYCAHEYTQANAKFALSVDPENAALARRADEIATARARGEATVPTRIGLEKETNPFLRAADAGLRAQLGLESARDADVFAEVRRRKDVF